MAQIFWARHVLFHAGFVAPNTKNVSALSLNPRNFAVFKTKISFHCTPKEMKLTAIIKYHKVIKFVKLVRCLLGAKLRANEAKCIQ